MQEEEEKEEEYINKVAQQWTIDPVSGRPIPPSEQEVVEEEEEEDEEEEEEDEEELTVPLTVTLVVLLGTLKIASSANSLGCCNSYSWYSLI